MTAQEREEWIKYLDLCEQADRDGLTRPSPPEQPHGIFMPKYDIDAFALQCIRELKKWDAMLKTLEKRKASIVAGKKTTKCG